MLHVNTVLREIVFCPTNAVRVRRKSLRRVSDTVYTSDMSRKKSIESPRISFRAQSDVADFLRRLEKRAVNRSRVINQILARHLQDVCSRFGV